MKPKGIIKPDRETISRLGDKLDDRTYACHDIGTIKEILYEYHGHALLVPLGVRTELSTYDFGREAQMGKVPSWKWRCVRIYSTGGMEEAILQDDGTFEISDQFGECTNGTIAIDDPRILCILHRMQVVKKQQMEKIKKYKGQSREAGDIPSEIIEEATSYIPTREAAIAYLKARLLPTSYFDEPPVGSGWCIKDGHNGPYYSKIED